jgi:hypothetical protein
MTGLVLCCIWAGVALLQVLLLEGMLIYAPYDDDGYIRAVKR